jgi:hypothetical protein
MYYDRRAISFAKLHIPSQIKMECTTTNKAFLVGADLQVSFSVHLIMSLIGDSAQTLYVAIRRDRAATSLTFLMSQN